MDILLLSPEHFRGRKGRYQHFAEELARQHRVFFVNQPSSVLRHRGLGVSVEKHRDNLLSITLPSGIPGRRLPFLHRWNQSRWLRCLRSVLPEHRWGAQANTAVIIQTPFWDHAPQALCPSVSVYDCHDVWADIQGECSAAIDGMEGALMQSCDLILSSSEATGARATHFGRDACMVPNGCDYPHFCGVSCLASAPEIEFLPMPRLVYVGGIDACFDSDALETAACALPNASFILIGKIACNQIKIRLSKTANIYSLGEKKYDDLPAYLAGCDACLLPFRLIPHALGRDCVKLYEYLATGLPIAAAPIPRAIDFAPYLHLSRDESPSSFAEACKAAIADKNKEQRRLRQEFARQHTWAQRIACVESLMERFLSGSVKET